MRLIQHQIAALVCLSTLCAAGCSWFDREPVDPFATAQPAAGGSGVVQASYDQQGRQVVTPERQEEEPVGWERFSGENLKKSFKKAIGKGPNQPIALERYQEG